MSSATEKELALLHQAVAKAMRNTLEQSEVASDLLNKYEGELPEDVVELLDSLTVIQPAMLSAMVKFLKDNNITAQIEEGDDISEVEKRLQKKTRISSNVIPFE